MNDSNCRSFTQDEEQSFSDRYQEVPHLEFPIVLKDEANEFDAIFFTPRNICLYSWGNNITTAEVPEPVLGKSKFKLL